MVQITVMLESSTNSMKRYKNKPQKKCKYYGSVHEPQYVQHMEVAAQDGGELITSGVFAKVQAGRWQEK